MNIIEIWKDIKGYEGMYKVSNFGKVMNVKTQRIISDYSMKGYRMVQLWKNNIRKGICVHRLVAEAFIDNPYNLPQVNHIDENKSNNNVTNLEWCSISYNQNHGTINERRRNIMKGRAPYTMTDEHRHKISTSMKSIRKNSNDSKYIYL